MLARTSRHFHVDICENGFDPKRNSFTQHYGGKALDASLLLIPQVGFLAVDDPRVVGTIRAIEQELVCNGFVLRYFATPVTVSAGTTYIASYHTAGNYSADPNLFANAVTNGPLTAPSSASSGGNGVYAYGTGNLFPTNSYNSTSHGVDVLFRAQLAA